MYFDKYYEVIQDPRFYKDQSFNFIEKFTSSLLPIQKQVTQAELENLLQIQKNLPQKDPEVPEFYLNILSDLTENSSRTHREDAENRKTKR